MYIIYVYHVVGILIMVYGGKLLYHTKSCLTKKMDLKLLFDEMWNRNLYNDILFNAEIEKQEELR